MIAMTPASSLLLVWVTFSALVLGGVVAVLVWAVRSGQFGDQELARRLPLESGIPGDAPAPAARVAAQGRTRGKAQGGAREQAIGREGGGPDVQP